MRPAYLRFLHLALCGAVLVSSGTLAGAADPTDPLANAAPAVEVPKVLSDTMGPFTTNETVDKKFPLPQDPKLIWRFRSSCREHNRSATVAMFEKRGQTTAKWAGQARAAMEAYALAYSRTAAPREGVYYQAFQKALLGVDAACDDPLIGYWRLRHLATTDFVKFTELPQHVAVAEALVRSGRHPVLALHAAFNNRATVASLKEVRGSPVTDADVAAAGALFERASRAALAVAGKGDWPDLYDLSLLEVDHRMSEGAGRLAAWKAVDKRLADLKDGGWVRNAVEGKVLILAAWDARGSGPGGTVSDEQFELFAARLKKAKAKLEAAWKADPSLPQPATNMLYVAKGLGFEREEMETWFRRAMEANPDNLEACEAKKEWLQPNWHGTNEDVSEFVVQCLRSGNFFGKLPYLAEVPRARGLPHDQPEAVNQYVQNDATWVPFHAVAEAHLARYPDDLWARSRYAFHACLWKKWDVATAQFDRIGDTPWRGWFEHEGEYATMKKMAQEMAATK
ncbi:hypothetical protein [Limnoglobus roseus]|uniref:DUF4034 domain-containing protein n=1 Tax=Limnoglobus roseus TaxID=2598579 RepID=A0A5C1ACS2_9BACT|nr:hypothetical protein [Limnoglobus roseus]QEL16435.1 hypothetical protein PX52LOC_03389 [Limnoglobus roseus]